MKFDGRTVLHAAGLAATAQVLGVLAALVLSQGQLQLLSEGQLGLAVAFTALSSTMAVLVAGKSAQERSSARSQ